MMREAQPNPRMRGIAVEGRPADCVKLAARALWQEWYGPGARPDLVVSGMNSGANVGINVIYSGTVGAAVEGAFLGVPAIAVSLHMGGGASHWRRAAELARHAIDRVLKHRIDPHTVININVPRTHAADAPIPAIKVVNMNTAAGIDNYERLADECINLAALEGLARNKLGQSFFEIDPLDSPTWKAVVDQQTPPPLPADMPVMVSQGLADQVVLPWPNAILQESWCAAGSTITALWLEGVGHLQMPFAAGPDAVPWIADRFAGLPAPSSCDVPPPVPPSPPSP